MRNSVNGRAFGFQDHLWDLSDFLSTGSRDGEFRLDAPGRWDQLSPQSVRATIRAQSVDFRETFSMRLAVQICGRAIRVSCGANPEGPGPRTIQGFSIDASRRKMRTGHIGAPRWGCMGQDHPHRCLCHAMPRLAKGQLLPRRRLTLGTLCLESRRSPSGILKTVQRLLRRPRLSWIHDAELRACAGRGDEHLPHPFKPALGSAVLTSTVPTWPHCENSHNNPNLLALASKLCQGV